MKRETRANINGVEVYKSEYLHVTGDCLKGTLMKAIESVSLFHMEKYHKKFFMMEFSQPYCYFYDDETTDSFSRAHKQTDLVSCRAIDDSEVSDLLAEREKKRSSSFFRRALQEKVVRCSWNFPFVIEFPDKQYECYAPTRNDRDEWVHVLSTIGEMNRLGVRLEDHSPFEWLREQERKKQKQLEEEKMTETARFRAEEAEMEQELFENVHVWLRLNQERMQLHKPVVPAYESEHLTLNSEGVRGVCYLVNKFTQSMISVDDIETTQTGRTMLTHIELFLNMHIQTFLVQKIGVASVSKYTFNEITSVETTDVAPTKKELDHYKVEHCFIHCIKLQVKNNPKKILAFASDEDRQQWVRCLQLIIQMKNLGIDSGKVNIFTFEQFRQYQLKVAYEQRLLLSSDAVSPAKTPINARNLSPASLQSLSLHQRQPSVDSVHLNYRTTGRSKATRNSSIENIEEKIMAFETATFSMSFRCIEGYLIKEVEKL